MTGDIESYKTGEIEIRVRYPEADQMGVLHHSQYWIYFEMGRTELLRATGLTYRDIEASGVFLVLSKCACRFLAPARYDEELILITRVTKMGAARIDHAYELRRKSDNTLLTTAETTLACVDRTGKVQPLPSSIRKFNQE
jgi:acyl-CoA thioester hydrolase